MIDVELHTIKGTYTNCTHASVKYLQSINLLFLLWPVIHYLTSRINKQGVLLSFGGVKNIEKLISGEGEGGHLFGT